MTQATSNRIGDLVGRLLDRGYERAARATLEAVTRSLQSGIVAQRLQELEAEARRLDAAGQRLHPDNAVLRALIADMEPVLRRQAARIDVGAADVQRAGIDAANTLTHQLTLNGLTDQQLARIGIQWNVPNPEAINAAVNYVDMPAFEDLLKKFPGDILGVVRNQAIRGLVEGWNPVATAERIVQMAQGLSVAKTNSLLRTLQLISLRDATVIQQQANADILAYQIRVGTLDARICLACLALHGTRLEIGERVDDHDQGRCIGVAVVNGVTRNVMTGVEYWGTLNETSQRQLAGDSAYELIASGRAQLRDFVQAYTSPVFGQMLREASAQSVAARVGR